MTILFSTDNKFSTHLEVALCSIYENNPPVFNVFVADGGISDDNKVRFKKIEQHYGFKIQWIDVYESKLQGLPMLPTLSNASYYRLLVGDLLPLCSRVLYLDCDVVVDKLLLPLWRNKTKHTISAVSDPGINDEQRQLLGVEPKGNYFNSGVMMIDVNKWIRQDIGNITLDYLRHNKEKIVYLDQDALNAVLCGKWTHLPLEYNVVIHFYKGHGYHGNADMFTLKQCQHAVNNAVIIHFAGHDKPGNHPCADIYLKYAAIRDAIIK